MSKEYQSFRKRLMHLYGTKSNAKAIWAIAKNWIALIGSFLLIHLSLSELPKETAGIVYVFLSFVVGCCLRGFDNLTHEASHQNIFTSARLHSVLQFLFSYPVFKTVEDYRPGHFKHHRNYVTKKDDDPDTQQNIRWGVENLPANKSWKQIIWYYLIRFLIGYYVIDNIRYGLVPHLRSKKSTSGRIIFWTTILLLVAITNSWLIFFAGYIVPYLIWLPYIRFITESSKHTNVNLENEFSTSRNNIGLIHQIFLHPHNDGFHQMHHFMASIPFYNLKKAYMYIKTDPLVKAALIESHNPYETILQEFKMK